MSHSLTAHEATAALLEHMAQAVPAGIKHFCPYKMPCSLRIKELLAAGADVNAADHEGLTPLLRALSWDYASLGSFAQQEVHFILVALITNDADLQARTPEGNTAWTLAAQAHDWRTALITCEQQRRTLPGLREQVEFISPNWAGFSQQSDAELNAHFFHACEMQELLGDGPGNQFGSQLNLIKYLIYLNSAVVSATDAAGRTGLDIAVDAQLWKLADTLVLRGSPLDRQDSAGNTALHRLCAQDQDDRAAALAQLLVWQGARTDIANTAGQTALDIALECDNLSVLGAIEAALDVRADAARAPQSRPTL